MSVKYMILGCLLDEPAHGYEIRQNFKSHYNHTHGLNEGQLYTVLRKMEEDGLITRELVHQEKNPSKKIIRITEEGRQEFYHWLESETDHEAVYDFFHIYPFLQKCNYLMHIPKSNAYDLLKRQLEKEKEKLQDFLRIREGMVKRNVNRYRINILNFGIDFQELKIKWLNRLLNEVQKET